jgi:hypothetical protein
LYRRTNREIPKLASIYVGLAIEVIVDFKKKFSNEKKTARQIDLVKKCIFTIIDNTCIKFQVIANELLESVKRMEDSLKKLQKVRQTSKSSANIAGHNRSSSGGLTAISMSDDDKIRLQLSIDIIELGNLLSSNFEGYKGGSNFELLTLIVEDINKTITSGNSNSQKSLTQTENTIHMSDSNSNFIVLEENETK